MAETFKVPADSINENSSAENIERWDSFGYLQLVTNLEEEYHVSFDETELLRMTSYRSIKAILEGKGIEI
ncbi:acyl carrier protein [Prosthecobacter sp.]|uniref:acyl carrier protein n=1 Tax=Prosthecobacter sp. TaxID=1965333 RepID=UPI002AB8FA4B|nr:acyl carrier protein [Prosthecobacter sp.]MDZ4405799.1 acyl carrier protein [Prosthecobacter sp.]